MAIELLSVGSNSGVAHLAHLGGGIIGFIYILLSRNNIDDLFRFNKKPKVTSTKPTNIYSNRFYEKYNASSEEDADYYVKKPGGNVDQDRVDEILDKISKEGYKNLTEEEKRILFEASKKIN
jgi:hypothetical protein